ncbi:MAG: hypothetical protein QM644_18630 [Mobilitalea sp.]
MKFKKVAALLLASVLTFSLVGCGSNNSGKKDDTKPTDKPAVEQEDNGGDTTPEAAKPLEGKLVVWTLAADLEQFSAYFMEKNPGVELLKVSCKCPNY